MISINNLTVRYTTDRNVIHSLNLVLAEGKIHGIVGLNGSGKTTLLNTLFGLMKPCDSQIMWHQQPLTKKHIAILPTENFFYSYITGREYLMVIDNPAFDADKWNDLFELPLDQLIDNYSTGMKKKLAFLAVLKQDKPILILDEPFNGIDMESCSIMRSILLKIKEKGKTILITSHIIETLTNLCDQIHHLENGTIKQSRSKSEFDAFEKEIFDLLESKNQQRIDNLII